jgi:hypothetical protein
MHPNETSSTHDENGRWKLIVFIVDFMKTDPMRAAAGNLMSVTIPPKDNPNDKCCTEE